MIFNPHAFIFFIEVINYKSSLNHLVLALWKFSGTVSFCVVYKCHGYNSHDLGSNSLELISVHLDCVQRMCQVLSPFFMWIVRKWNLIEHRLIRLFIYFNFKFEQIVSVLRPSHIISAQYLLSAGKFYWKLRMLLVSNACRKLSAFDQRVFYIMVLEMIIKTMIIKNHSISIILYTFNKF